MENIAKVAVGTVILLYGIYGYLNGSIYSLPGRHSPNIRLLVNGNGLIFCALSYVAFAFVLYAWAVPFGKEYSQRKARKVKKYVRISMFGLFLVGITLQAAGQILG